MTEKENRRNVERSREIVGNVQSEREKGGVREWKGEI